MASYTVANKPNGLAVRVIHIPELAKEIVDWVHETKDLLNVALTCNALCIPAYQNLHATLSCFSLFKPCPLNHLVGFPDDRQAMVFKYIKKLILGLSHLTEYSGAPLTILECLEITYQ
ncbi:hypothetical protein M501DRAFT_211662 [Patellaria atrata CBS 101060]|uniref:F-box domain-containing protein n=1 Tax=Patellaria atrata CBS 101060 TaxID=1346257 RepID=A0A9P4VL07_9PEZI|nr:hypothetical protein M501DRAFT_211662 [Patellaria atrata CBS 101060]